MLPSDAATQTSRPSGGTLFTASSTWIRMLPTWGPLPCTRTISCPSRTSGISMVAVSRAFSCCSHCVPSWPFLMSALPPKATTIRRRRVMSGEPLEDVVEIRLADLLQLVRDAQRRLLEVDGAAQVDGGGDQDQVALHPVDGL